MISKQIEIESIKLMQQEFYGIFGHDHNAQMFKQYIKGELIFIISYNPEMLCELMDYYVLSKADMAICMGVSTACFNSLLKLKFSLPKLFDVRIGYATIILILGSKKYGLNRFLKSYKYYLQKHRMAAPLPTYVYLEIIKLLSLDSQVSISYFWSELIPVSAIELPSCFNNKQDF